MILNRIAKTVGLGIRGVVIVGATVGSAVIDEVKSVPDALKDGLGLEPKDTTTKIDVPTQGGNNKSIFETV